MERFIILFVRFLSNVAKSFIWVMAPYTLKVERHTDTGYITPHSLAAIWINTMINTGAWKGD